MGDRTLIYALQGVLGIIVQPTVGRLLGEALPLKWREYNPPLDPMSLIIAEDLYVSYGAQDVLQGVTIAIPHQARVALVGRNGIGKSALLKVLAGIERPSSGAVRRARDLEIGYLPQNMSEAQHLGVSESTTLYELALQAFSHLQQTERKLSELEGMMGDPREAEQAIALYGPLQESFEREGGYAYQASCERVLRGLGFSDKQFTQPVGQLSGGERTRAHLARLLLQDPDVLLLDEPTNHLDIAGTGWLEAWLQAWPGALVLVSHDRVFLDAVTDRTVEVARAELSEYRGNYSQYLDQRDERLERRRARLDRQQAHIEKEQEYIKRNIAGQNSRQAKGRRTRLERYLQEEALGPEEESPRLSVRLASSRRSGRIALKTTNLTISDPATGGPLIRLPDVSVGRSERIAIIGPNGSGKTTLIRTLLGKVPPYEGAFELGAEVSIGYFPQILPRPAPGQTVLDVLLETDSGLLISQARQHAARFGFQGEDIRKAAAALSGGERARLELARLTLSGTNTLFLDEPTHHLDLDSQRELQTALQGFAGTLLFVSHDRYLIKQLATEIWGFEAHRNEIRVVKGDYGDYLRVLEREQTQVQSRAEPRPERGQARVPTERSLLQSQIDAAEARVIELEGQLANLTQQIEASQDDPEQVIALGSRYAALEGELERWLDRWERLEMQNQGA